MNKETRIKEMAKIAEEAIDNQTAHNCPYSPCRYQGSSICCDTCVTIEALYNADYRKQEWISVEDRLPEVEQIVLCCLGLVQNVYTHIREITLGKIATGTIKKTNRLRIGCSFLNYQR